MIRHKHPTVGIGRTLTSVFPTEADPPETRSGAEAEMREGVSAIGGGQMCRDRLRPDPDHWAAGDVATDRSAPARGGIWHSASWAPAAAPGRYEYALGWSAVGRRQKSAMLCCALRTACEHCKLVVSFRSNQIVSPDPSKTDLPGEWDLLVKRMLGLVLM